MCSGSPRRSSPFQWLLTNKSCLSSWDLLGKARMISPPEINVNFRLPVFLYFPSSMLKPLCSPPQPPPTPPSFAVPASRARLGMPELGGTAKGPRSSLVNPVDWAVLEGFYQAREMRDGRARSGLGK